MFPREALGRLQVAVQWAPGDGMAARRNHGSEARAGGADRNRGERSAAAVLRYPCGQGPRVKCDRGKISQRKKRIL